MTEILLYNTRSRQKEPLRPLDPANVRMYVCGPTVYDRSHIGNARAVVVFDTLFRLLRHRYGAEHVTYARNITDVDDKINARAAATRLPGETELQAIRRITDETTGWYHADMDALGALRPTIEPRATEFITPMVTMISELIASGHAYAAEGHVLFSVSSDPAYGTLSHRSLEDMRAGARVEVAPYKRDPMDFVLWKPSDATTPGWDSPWGRGRPGWHIECSAMSFELLGESFDIHGGGIDLAFPHHENEMAQSRCAHPHGDFAKIWMHNGMLNIEGDKMSKSLGNFFTVRELLDGNIDGQAIRLLLLSTHYRSPLDWSDKRLAEAIAKLTRWKHLKHRCRKAGIATDYDPDAVSVEAIEALSDDLNTPLALGRVLSDLAAKTQAGEEGAAVTFFSTLGFFGFDPDRLFDATREATIDRQLEYIDLIDDYRARITAARAEKDYAAADALKEKLIRAGHKVSINKDGIDIERTEEFSLANVELLK